MEVQGLSCNGCGSTDVEFDPVTRKIHCNQCGKEEYYSRAQLGATGKVAFAKDNAVHFFKEGNRENARKFAGDVLNTMQDNAAALFIMAYCDEFVEHRNGSIKHFFEKIDDIPLQNDEVDDLRILFVQAIYNLRDYETDMVTLMIKNHLVEAELDQFIDTVCPYCINKYPSADFMNAEREEFYCDVASHCTIPKTCLSLLKGIKGNPDSPYVSHSFYMKAKTKYFFDNYVSRVGKVISSMRDNQYKQKFVTAFKESLSQYQTDAAEG